MDEELQAVEWGISGMRFGMTDGKLDAIGKEKLQARGEAGLSTARLSAADLEKRNSMGAQFDTQ
eukprot:2539055-Pleurochrysis_carterae.AAC.1